MSIFNKYAKAIANLFKCVALTVAEFFLDLFIQPIVSICNMFNCSKISALLKSWTVVIKEKENSEYESLQQYGYLSLLYSLIVLVVCVGGMVLLFSNIYTFSLVVASVFCDILNKRSTRALTDVVEVNHG